MMLYFHDSPRVKRVSGAANNIRERLSGRKPVSWRSERAIGYIVGFATGLSASES